IADDHRLVVDAVSMALRTEPDFSIRTAASLPDVLAALAQEPVDLVLLDVNMPGMAGIPSVAEVVRAAGDGAVALFSGNIDDSFARLAMREGTVGFIPKSTPLRVLPAAIRLIRSGAFYMPAAPEAAEADPAGGATRSLSEHEQEIMHLVQSGLTNKEIARRLSTTEVRVKMHLRAIYTKLGAKNRAHATTILRGRGMS
ncbi:MAG: response regulator transcription factor, partial [Rubellimicrobium sp.]|nr:response regulator transcription factor [Rubellimicrobium sp.]